MRNSVGPLSRLKTKRSKVEKISISLKEIFSSILPEVIYEESSAHAKKFEKFLPKDAFPNPLTDEEIETIRQK